MGQHSLFSEITRPHWNKLYKSVDFMDLIRIGILVQTWMPKLVMLFDWMRLKTLLLKHFVVIWNIQCNIVWIILEWFFPMHVIFVPITNPRWLSSQDMYSLTLNTLGKWIKKTTLSLYSLKGNTFNIYLSEQLIQLLTVPQLACYTFKRNYCSTSLPVNTILYAHSNFKDSIHVPLEKYVKLLPLNYQV